jgi:hypothetical protein
MTRYGVMEQLSAVLGALGGEIEAVAEFDRARDVVVSLIEIRADRGAIYSALDEVYARLEKIRISYFRLEALFLQAGWSMERPCELPSALRAALDAQVVPHQQHLARTAQVEEVIGSWLSEEGWRHTAQRYYTTRQRTEEAHARKARRRRGGD